MDIQCSLKGCKKTHRFLCKCQASFYLCSLHLQAHLEEFPAHSQRIRPSFLKFTSSEMNLLESTISQISKIFLASSEHKDASSTYFILIKVLWALVKLEGVPLDSGVNLIEEIYQIKREHRIILNPTLSDIVKNYGFDIYQQTSENIQFPIYSLELKDKELVLADHTKTIEFIPNKNFSKNGSCLVISINEVLVTNNKNSYSVNVDTKTVKSICKFNFSRISNTLTWIDSFPAAIGGIGETENILKSVEVLDNDKWVAYPQLNIKRACSAACQINSKTYVFSGVHLPNQNSNIVEMFHHGRWTILALKLNLNTKINVNTAINNQLILFGSHFAVKKVDFDKEKIENLKSISYPVKAKSTVIQKKNKLLFLQNNKIIEYIIYSFFHRFIFKL